VLKGTRTEEQESVQTYSKFMELGDELDFVVSFGYVKDVIGTEGGRGT